VSSAKARADTKAGLERPAAAHLVFAKGAHRGGVAALLQPTVLIAREEPACYLGFG
jgi:hypothetical protein